MKMQRDGGAVIGQPASDKQAAIGCLTFLIAAVIVVYFLFFSDACSKDFITPYKESGFLTLENAQVVRVKSDDTYITFEDQVYREGDVVHFFVSVGEEGPDIYPTKYIITKVDLVSPVQKELYSASQTGFGDTVSFWKKTLSNITYNEKDTIPVDITLDKSCFDSRENPKGTIEINISYIFAQALGETFVPGSSSEKIVLGIVPVGDEISKSYLLRDPNRKVLFYAVKNDNNSWTVVKNFEDTEKWDKLVSWAPVQDPETNTVIYAGVKYGRFDYVIDNGFKRKTSFEGPGYHAFGYFSPMFERNGKALFCARRDKNWCMIYDGIEYRFHDGIGNSSIVLPDDGRFLYAAMDEGTWSIYLASSQGTEFPVLSGTYGIRDPVYEHPIYNHKNGRIAFTAAASKDFRTVFAVYSKRKATDLNEESIKENIVTGDVYDKINEFWWSPKEELVYAGKRTGSKSFVIVIENKEYTYEKAKEYLLSQCTEEYANRKEEVINILNKLRREFE